jgi:ubiquinone/menaquinone biosynthesis C-methylase UbiE
MIGTNNLANRNDWIREQLAAIPAGSRILDAGAGELQWKDSCSHLQYVSQDLAEYDGSGDGKGLQCNNWNGSQVDIICDICEIPEADGSFDAILCTEVLNHVPDPVSALQELKRLLKPGGTLLLTESFCGLTNQSPYFYYTGLSENFYRYWLGDYELEIKFNGNYYEWIAQEIRRLLSWKKISPVPAQMILIEMADASLSDTCSHEILCYGLLVKAIKQLNK